MKETDLEILRVEISKLELKRGDILIIKFPSNTPGHKISNSIKEFNTNIGPILADMGVHVMVVNGEVEFSILRQSAMEVIE